MKKFDEMFKKEQERIDIKKELAQNEKQAEIDVVVNFCNEGLFEFLEYLHNKFYVVKNSVNYHVDGEKYTRDIVYGYTNKESGLKTINNWGYFRGGIQHQWSNGGIYDSIKVECIDFKPVLTYERRKMDLDTLIETVIAQIQKTINEPPGNFKIIEK